VRCPAVALLAAALAALWATASAAEPPSPLQERLEAALSAHPDDPDLSWAYAMALARGGEVDAAVSRLRDFESRWPGRRPDLLVEMARLLFELGDYAGASASADRALLVLPENGYAHFYRGLALRELGKRPEAHRALAEAARLEPALEPETLLVRAVDLLDEGRDEEAEALLERAIALDPSEETLRRIRLLLPRREPLGQRRWWKLDAYAGGEWDSNVTLDSNSGSEFLDLPRDRDDWRGAWGGGLTLRPFRRERAGLLLGYRYDQAMQDELGEYDYVVNSGFASASLRPHARVLLRLDGTVADTRRDGDDYLLLGSLRPNLFFELGDSWGTTRLFGEVAWHEYEDQAVLTPLERDGLEWGVGLEHYLRLFGTQAWASLGARFERVETQARKSSIPGVLSFAGDYDRDVWAGSARLHAPLPWRIDADAALEVAYEDYPHDNLVAWVTDGALRRQRRDSYGELRVALARPIAPLVRLEIVWTGVLRASNTDVFDYQRHIAGVYLRVSSE
jgi:tetratricopeptide (TPR) repeat protein